MFDSRWSYAEIKNTFRWQVCKRLEEDNQQDDCAVIRYLQKLMELPLEKLLELAIYKVGLELLIKKENDFIDDTGELKEFNKTAKWRNTTTSRSHGLQMEREQYEGTPECFASSSRRH
ncbi:unnamed protein product [Rhizophagus irregularis]|nr:unnamed protein product [Rhizophagus irregularis]